jgi:hypothetical protein
VKDMTVLAMSIVVTVPLALGAYACGSPPPAVVPDVVAADCVIHRTTLELKCVDDNATKAAIDACRADVKSKNNCTSDAGGQ